MNTIEHKLKELDKFEDFWGSLKNATPIDDVAFETTLEGFSMRTIKSNFFTYDDLTAIHNYSTQNAMRYAIWGMKGSMVGTCVVVEFKTTI